MLVCDNGEHHMWSCDIKWLWAERVMKITESAVPHDDISGIW